MNKTSLLGNEIELAYGKGLPQRSRTPGTFPVYGSNGQVDTHTESLIKGPGIIIGRKGSVGEVIWSDEDFWPIDTTYYVKLKNSDDSLRYWYYQLKTLGLNHLNSHSAIPGLNRDVAYAKHVIKRAPDQQKKIANILSIIDEKIELNQKMNETLKETGQTLFRHYFVNNPEAAKWKWVPIKDLCEKVASGGTPATKKGSYYGGGIQWYSTKELKDNFLFCSEKTITDEGLNNSAAKLFPRNTVMMAIYAAPTVGRLGILTSDASFNQAACGLVAKSEVGYEFIYLYLLLSRIELNNMANGAAQQNISVGKVREFKVMRPGDETINSFRKKIKPIFAQIKYNSEQIQTLTNLRDTLLPRLISGNVKVN